MRPLRLVAFGQHLVKYLDGLALQTHLSSQLTAGTASIDTLVLLQHSPVYTVGKRGKNEHFKMPVQDLINRHVDVCNVPRGGEVTYHGPGQLVAYPIVRLRQMGRGARAWVEGLEDTLIDSLAHFGVSAQGRIPGATGVWVDDRKIAAIGVKISQGVSSHGIALNITTDLSAYDVIVPCGIEDKAVTSLGQELHRLHGLPEQAAVLAAVQSLARTTGHQLQPGGLTLRGLLSQQGRLTQGTSIPSVAASSGAIDATAGSQGYVAGGATRHAQGERPLTPGTPSTAVIPPPDVVRQSHGPHGCVHPNTLPTPPAVDQLMQCATAVFATQFCKHFGFEVTEVLECDSVAEAVAHCKG